MIGQSAKGATAFLDVMRGIIVVIAIIAFLLYFTYMFLGPYFS